MAINPLPFIASIPDPGQAFLQSFNAARQQRAQQDQMLAQQQAQQARQQQYAQWVQRLRTDRSPQAMSEFMLQFPEQADAITKAFAPMDEANKRTQLGFYAQALSALDRGDSDFAKQLTNERLAAARNTPGQEQTVKELEYGLTQIDQNPDALKAMLAFTVQQLDPKAYEALYKREKEQPYVVVPGVGVVLRRHIEAADAAAARGEVSDPSVSVIQEGATATNPKTGEKVKFQNGQWVPVGGGSSNATGNFRASGNPR